MCTGDRKEVLIKLEKAVLSANNRVAAANRSFFRAHRILALNLLSGPGSGKTSILCRTIEILKDRVPVAVIEGDQETVFDAERIRASGVRAVQINTAEGCHLEAESVRKAIEHLHPEERSILFIENVGNLVCPAAFDLGEDAKVIVLSVTEGEDKPLKYPYMFAAGSLLLLNKTDLLPHLDFDYEQCKTYARRINPSIEVIGMSAFTGNGFNRWICWLETRLKQFQNE